MVDFQAIRESHYQAAIEAGERLEAAKHANKKMKDIRFLEAQHHQAWQRVWAMDAAIRSQESAA